MYFFRARKRGSWTLLVLQLLCVLLCPTKGRPSLEEDEDFADEDKEFHEDEAADEGWGDDEGEEETTNVGSNEEDGPDINDVCYHETIKDLSLRCIATMKCCISSQCKPFGYGDNNKCFDKFKMIKDAQLREKEKSMDVID